MACIARGKTWGITRRLRAARSPPVLRVGSNACLAVERMLPDGLSREGKTHEDVRCTPRDREHSISGRCLLIGAS
jgi:hypothetical protein